MSIVAATLRRHFALCDTFLNTLCMVLYHNFAFQWILLVWCNVSSFFTVHCVPFCTILSSAACWTEASLGVVGTALCAMYSQLRTLWTLTELWRKTVPVDIIYPASLVPDSLPPLGIYSWPHNQQWHNTLAKLSILCSPIVKTTLVNTHRVDIDKPGENTAWWTVRGDYWL